jgi:thiol-disulfide isomerase/thioredoxin
LVCLWKRGIVVVIRQLRSRYGLAALALGLVAALCLLPSSDGAGSTTVQSTFAAAEAAPEAEFRTAAGEHLTLADFRGRVVLLNLWATWCGPCRVEMPSLDRLQAMHRRTDLAVLAISVDESASIAVQQLFEQWGLRNLTPYLDAHGATVHALGARVVPTTLIIDRDGYVVRSVVGSRQWDSPDSVALIRRYIERVVARP